MARGVTLSVLQDDAWKAEVRRAMLAEYVIVGDASFYLPKGRHRVIMESAAIEYDGVIDTAPAHARRVIEATLPKYARPIMRKSDACFTRLCVPSFWPGETIAEYGQYVDLHAAYCSMYRWLALDDGYLAVNPRAEGMLWPLAVTLEKQKRMRNCIVGLAHSGPLQSYNRGRYRPLYNRNKWYSPALWYNVQSTLHWLAGQAIRAGAVYVNTDGYIFPDVAPGVFIDTLDRMGMEWQVKAAGRLHVRGLGAYRCGKSASMTYRTVLNPCPVNNIFAVNGPRLWRFWDSVKSRTIAWCIRNGWSQSEYTEPVPFGSAFDAPRADEELHPKLAAARGIRTERRDDHGG